jgi:acyl carrier protein
MNNPFQIDHVTDQLRVLLADLLVTAEDEVNADSRLIDDLGADSLDLVDLNFRIGKQFGCVLPKTSVLDHAADLLGELSGIVNDGRLTALGAALMHHSINAYAADQVRPGMTAAEVFAATSVRNWAAQVIAIFDALPERCGACGHSHAIRDDRGQAVCGQCAARLVPADGDSVSRRHVEAFLEPQLRKSA